MTEIKPFDSLKEINTLKKYHTKITNSYLIDYIDQLTTKSLNLENKQKDYIKEINELKSKLIYLENSINIIYSNISNIKEKITDHDKETKILNFESDLKEIIPISKNEIICEYEINKINKIIHLFTDKEEYKNNFELYIDNKFIPYKNYYQFEELGKHILKIKIKKILTNIAYLFDESTYLIKVDLSNFDSSQITSFQNLFGTR